MKSRHLGQFNIEQKGSNSFDMEENWSKSSICEINNPPPTEVIWEHICPECGEGGRRVYVAIECRVTLDLGYRTLL